MTKKAFSPTPSYSKDSTPAQTPDQTDVLPLPKEPWDDSSNRPTTEEPQAYWKNIGYLGETKDFASHSYSPKEPLP